jgi:hypothetical protein
MLFAASRLLMGGRREADIICRKALSVASVGTKSD